jgi:hypothetical protein
VISSDPFVVAAVLGVVAVLQGTRSVAAHASEGVGERGGRAVEYEDRLTHAGGDDLGRCFLLTMMMKRMSLRTDRRLACRLV